LGDPANCGGDRAFEFDDGQHPLRRHSNSRDSREPVADAAQCRFKYSRFDLAHVLTGVDACSRLRIDLDRKLELLQQVIACAWLSCWLRRARVSAKWLTWVKY
jgi:hypothetical protein